MVDHEARLEQDKFDRYFDHFLLIDVTRKHPDAQMNIGGMVVGVYRLMRCDQARALGRFYSDDEYDLAPLRATGRSLLELGRSCVHREYRGGSAMYELWTGLSDYIQAHKIEILFGVASFHGTDLDALSQPLSLLHHRHLAPEPLRVRSKDTPFPTLNRRPLEKIDAKEAMLQTPALIKAYLRLGGGVGDGAFIDHEFNTIDVCLIMETAKVNDRQRKIYAREVK